MFGVYQSTFISTTVLHKGLFQIMMKSLIKNTFHNEQLLLY